LKLPPLKKDEKHCFARGGFKNASVNSIALICGAFALSLFKNHIAEYTKA